MPSKHRSQDLRQVLIEVVCGLPKDRWNIAAVQVCCYKMIAESIAKSLLINVYRESF